jgi:hypothetical protein
VTADETSHDDAHGEYADSEGQDSQPDEGGVAPADVARIPLWMPDPEDDLSDIITNISGHKASTRKRRANDLKTRQIIAAGMRLLERQFGPAEEAHDDDVERREYPFFQWLSRAQIAAEVVVADPAIEPYDRAQHQKTFEKAMERLWSPVDRFLTDLLRYALHVRHWSLHIALAKEATDILIDGATGGDLIDSIQTVAYEDLKLGIDSPAWRLQLITAALAEQHPKLRDVQVKTYDDVDSSWIRVYDQLFLAAGWKLRPGVTMQDLNLMLSTAAEGAALRALITPKGVIDHVAKTSILGKLALALVVACIDPGDGLTLEERATQASGAAGS